MVSDAFKSHLCGRLIPFWERLRDGQYGGYYGWMDSGLEVDREAVKGCILNSRILWFFSNAAMCLEGEDFRGCRKEAGHWPDGAMAPGTEDEQECRADSLREHADWAYAFLRDKCMDAERGGVYWSLDYKGQPEDTTKHTYNQAFAVYALSSYFRAFHEREALELAGRLIQVIEDRCFDEYGYKEAQDIAFCPIANDKLSENGVMADRTMNTLLHVLEAYTEYLLACREAERFLGRDWRTASEGNCPAAEERRWQESPGEEAGSALRGDCRTALDESLPAADRDVYGKRRWQQVVTEKLYWILNQVAEHVYNPARRRQEVFFDLHMNSLIDLHSYGHDIEAAWLMDRCLEALGDEELSRRLSPMLRCLEAEVYEKAYAHHSLANECERGVADEKRVWWVQAEGVVGFYNAYQKTGERRYLEAAEDIWGFIQEHLVDERPEGEWFWYTDAEGNPALEKPIVEPWKCPYHNGRMCMEIIGRSGK